MASWLLQRKERDHFTMSSCFLHMFFQDTKKIPVKTILFLVFFSWILLWVYLNSQRKKNNVFSDIIFNCYFFFPPFFVNCQTKEIGKKPLNNEHAIISDFGFQLFLLVTRLDFYLKWKFFQPFRELELQD